MKIALLTHTFDESAGWGRYAQMLRDELTARGHEVVVPELPHPWKCVANPLGIFRGRKLLRTFLRKEGVDVVHVVVEPYATLVRGITEPVVLSAHGTFVVPEHTQPWYMKALAHYFAQEYYHSVEQVIAVSSYTKKYLLAHYSIPENKVVVVPNGVVVPEEAPSDKESREILYVGELKPRKGLDLLLKALVVYEGEWNLTVAGKCKDDDPFMRELHAYIEKEGIGDRVSFVGRVSDEELEKLYQSAGVFVMPSVPRGGGVEGFGLVYLEAAARGVPSIGSIHSGAVDAIKDGVSGYVIDPFDTNAFVEALGNVLDAKRIKATDCYAWANKHKVSVFVDKIFEVYIQTTDHR